MDGSGESEMPARSDSERTSSNCVRTWRVRVSPRSTEGRRLAWSTVARVDAIEISLEDSWLDELNWDEGRGAAFNPLRIGSCS